MLDLKAGDWPRRVLIIRLGAIGDIVMASGLLSSLHKAYPGVRISWLVEPAVAGLLQETPDIEDVIVWPKEKWKELLRRGRCYALLREVLAFRQALHTCGYDWTIDVQGLLKSAVLARLSGARKCYGLASKEKADWLMDAVVERPVSSMMSSEYRAMAAFLGCDTRHFRLNLVATKPTQAKLEQRLHALTGGEEFIVFCPYTTRPQKHWFESHWLSLAELLYQRFGLQLLVLGGPLDEESGERLSERHPALVNLAGRTSLLESSEVIARAKLVVGVDTGITHMGIARCVPTLALFGSTRPYSETPFARARVLSQRLSCAPCGRKPTCAGRFDCMRELTPEQVFVAAESLVGKDEVLHENFAY